jgi:hypothetical protein
MDLLVLENRENRKRSKIAPWSKSTQLVYVRQLDEYPWHSYILYSIIP